MSARHTIDCCQPLFYAPVLQGRDSTILQKHNEVEGLGQDHFRRMVDLLMQHFSQAHGPIVTRLRGCDRRNSQARTDRSLKGGSVGLDGLLGGHEVSLGGEEGGFGGSDVEK
jgi:hypothetical protein